jgi:hypothetical protein
MGVELAVEIELRKSQAVRHVFCGSGVFGLAALGRFCSN